MGACFLVLLLAARHVVRTIPPLWCAVDRRRWAAVLRAKGTKCCFCSAPTRFVSSVTLRTYVRRAQLTGAERLLSYARKRPNAAALCSALLQSTLSLYLLYVVRMPVYVVRAASCARTYVPPVGWARIDSLSRQKILGTPGTYVPGHICTSR